MEKDKSRGIKHIKDKRKYKGNSTKNPKYLPPKSKPKLESNWDRYEFTEEDHDYKPNSSTDFALLSNVPISSGSHFQFKNDKKNDEFDQEESHLFSLNLDLLHKSIMTVPFYERLKIPKEYFKKDDIHRMDENAAKHLESYKLFLKSSDKHNVGDKVSNIAIKNFPDDDGTDIDGIKEIEEKETVTNNVENQDILELIENCSVEDHEALCSPACAEHNEDLEQWLDDILED